MLTTLSNLQADLLRVYENEKKILEAEIAGYKANSAKHDKAIQVRLHSSTSVLAVIPQARRCYAHAVCLPYSPWLWFADSALTVK